MKKFIASLIFFSSGVGLIHAANYYDNRWALGAGYGLAYPELPRDKFKDQYDRGRSIGGMLQYGLSDDLSLVGSYANVLVKRSDNKNELELQPVMLSFKYHPFTKSPVVPYLKAGAGVSMNRQEVPGIADDVRWNKFAWQGGLGLEWFINPGLSIGAEGLYQHFVATPDESPLRLINAMGFVNVYFGEDAKTRKLKDENTKTKEDNAKLAAEAETQKQAAAQSEQARADAEKARLAAEQSAQVARSTADAQVAAAQAQAQEAQAQMQQAQTEMDAIKQMVSKKEISPIVFATGSDKLLVDSYPTLDKVATTAKKYPALKLRVEGHTDNVGGDAANMTLSQKRAEAVRTYLVDKGGIPTDQIQATGFGKTKPVASNDTAEGRAQNRRVEFIFFLP